MYGGVKLTADDRKVRIVFYYENNEYMMKHTGTISILPKGAVAPLTRSACLLFFL
jgi:hypothetical protein